MNVSIVIPYLNEGRSLNELFQSIDFYMGQYQYECVIINDNSNEENTNLLLSIASEIRNIKIINNEKRVGQHKSICKGVKNADGDFILVMSADLQEDFNILPLMIEKCRHYDFVYGDRIARYDSNVFSKIANWLIHKLICSSYPVCGFDFYVFNAKYKKSLDDSRFVYPQLTLIKHIDGSIKIPYIRRNRKYDHSKWSLAKKIFLFIRILYYY